MHWATEFVGKRHEPGARGPESFDCYGLLWWIYAHRYGIPLDIHAGISAHSTAFLSTQIESAIDHDWEKVEKPADGYAVAMSQQHRYHHVGVYIEADGGKVLHCWDADKVIVDTIRRLRLKGMKRIDFYRHKQWPLSSKSQILSNR